MSALAKAVEKEKKRTFIKVALIGDNAIGKTSLMVKYVEGTFNQDYIVTLGTTHSRSTTSQQNYPTIIRSKLHGKGHPHEKRRYHIQHLGSGRSFFILLSSSAISYIIRSYCSLDVHSGQREYQHMLPVVCNEAVALLFLFDLTRKATLSSVRQWYKSARQFNKVTHS